MYAFQLICEKAVMVCNSGRALLKRKVWTQVQM